MKTIIKRGFDTVKWERFHLLHRQLARSELSKALKSGHHVSPTTARRCGEYAADVFGSKRFAPWLVFYSAIAGEFREGWIPDNFFGSRIVPALQGRYGNVSELRALGARLFGDDYFCDLAYFANGAFSTKHHLVPERAVSELLFQDNDLVIFKADNTSQSLGIKIFDVTNFDTESIREIGSGVFQKFLKQDRKLDEFAPGAVATLRLNTILTDTGDAEIRSGHIRFAMEGDKFLKVSNQIRVPVNLKSGEFWDYGYNSNWARLERHPDTRIAFSGLKMPFFSACKDIVLRLHQSFPLVQIIGWDLAVGEDEKCYVLEWNGWNNGLPFSEAVQGPCYSDLGWEKIQRPSHRFSGVLS